jgi:hypothetical protein
VSIADTLPVNLKIAEDFPIDLWKSQIFDRIHLLTIFEKVDDQSGLKRAGDLPEPGE